MARETAELNRTWSRVADAQAGDRQAFAELYGSYAPIVFKYVFARTGDRQLTEDLTSETFLRALRKLGSITYCGSPFRAWLLTIARNVVIDDAKSARRRLEVPLPEHFDAPANVADPAGAACHRALAVEVRSLLPDLSADQRMCVELRFLADLTVAEIASRMNRGPRAVSAIQVRALRKLAQLIRNSEVSFG